ATHSSARARCRKISAYFRAGAPRASWSPPGRVLLEERVQDELHEDDCADENVVGKARHPDHYDAVTDSAQHQDADDRAENSAASARKRGAADDHHSDDFEFVARPRYGRGRGDPERADHGG